MQLTPPDDPSIVTLWIGNVSDDISEDDLRGAIYAYGLIANLTLVRSAKCAFVEYVNRESAEYAATQLYNALMVSGHPLNVNWAKPKTQAMAGSTSTVVTDPLQMLPPPGMEGKAETVYSLPGVGGTNFAKPPLPDTLYPSEGQGQEGRPPPPSSAPPAKKQRSEANVVYPSMNPSRMGTSYN